jgi:predicted HTH domain antitoxin
MDKYNYIKNNIIKNTNISLSNDKSQKDIELLEKLLNDYSDNESRDSDNNEILDNILNEEIEEKINTKIEFNQCIIEERNEEIKKICQDLQDINEIFKYLNKLVHEQTNPIKEIETQIDETVNKTEKGIVSLKKANELHNMWLSQKNKFMLMSIAGLTINIPIVI